MHLLFVSHSSALMGAELTLLTAVREAVQVRGHQVTVAVPAEGPLLAELAEVGANVVVLPTRIWMGHRHNLVVGAVRMLQAAASIPRYRRFLARTRPDLVVTNSVIIPAGAIAARSAGVRHVWVVGESLLTNPNLRSALPRPTIARIIAKLSAGVVAVSGYVAGQLLSVTPTLRQRLRVIPPPITPPAAGPEPRPTRDAEKLERLLLLGHFNPEKGQKDAIEALGICLRAGRSFELKLAAVGGPEAKRALRELAHTNGVSGLVEISEWTDDPDALYRWADATLMLSRNEAFGRVTVESLMAGTPVIGFRAGATTEILADGGGVLVEPDADALATAMMGLAASGEAVGQLKADAIRRGRELISAPSSASQFIDYLEELQANL